MGMTTQKKQQNVVVASFGTFFENSSRDPAYNLNANHFFHRDSLGREGCVR
jgi:hypothetical protein